MSVAHDSRYASGNLIEITLPDGSKRPYVYGRGHASASQLGAGTIKWAFSLGDHLDAIAAGLLDTETNWWLIADVNGLLFPELDEALPIGSNTLSIGRDLLIPSRALLATS